MMAVDYMQPPANDDWDDRPFTDDEAPSAPRSANGAMPYSVFRERQAEREKDAIRQAAVTAKSLAEHVADLSKDGAVVRIPTGIPTLDTAMRGGLPLRRFGVLGGAPGAGKTSVVCRWAYQWSRDGRIVVGILAVDEGPEGIVDRCALYESAKRDLLDAGDTHEWARLSTAVQDLPIIIDDGSMTVESFATHLREVAGDRPAVLIADSLQTVRAEAKDARAADGKREQIDRVVRALKRASVEHNMMVLATCELSRAYYRSEALAKELNPLAAFKESGSIEYQAQTALVLTTPKGAGDLIDVWVAKNRGYRRAPFRLQLHADLSFHETERPSEDGDDDEAGDGRGDPRLEKDALAVLNIIAMHAGVGTRELRTECGAAELGIGNARLPIVLLYLERTGRIENRPEQRGSRTDPHYFAMGVTR